MKKKTMSVNAGHEYGYPLKSVFTVETGHCTVAAKVRFSYVLLLQFRVECHQGGCVLFC